MADRQDRWQKGGRCTPRLVLLRQYLRRRRSLLRNQCLVRGLVSQDQRVRLAMAWHSYVPDTLALPSAAASCTAASLVCATLIASLPLDLVGG